MTRSVFSRTYIELRHTLLSARQNAGLTQGQLAEKLGKPQSFVSKYERGERRLDVAEFLEVAHALQLDPTEVLRELIAATESRAG